MKNTLFHKCASRLKYYYLNIDLKMKLKLCFKRNLNKNKKFIIIRRVNGKYNGNFSNLMVFLPYLLEADKKNLIPVIDMKYCKNLYLDKKEVGKKNAWEYFYKQPSNYNLEEVIKSKNVFLSNEMQLKSIGDIFKNKENLKVWNRIYHKYIKLNNMMTNYIEKEYLNVFDTAIKEGARILGVKFRGSDYVELCPKGHSIQPTIKQMLEETDKCLQEFNCKYIYLAVEENKAKEAFIKKYGDKLLFYNCELFDEYENYKGMSSAKIATEVVTKNKGGRINNGIEYITTVMLLTKCNSFLTSETSGAILAMIIKGEYEHVRYIDLGRYH